MKSKETEKEVWIVKSWNTEMHVVNIMKMVKKHFTEEVKRFPKFQIIFPVTSYKLLNWANHEVWF